ncbi:TonB family protein [bacterium]|nr:TonB family protein [bacterium]
MLARAVPASMVLHALAFAALLLWGDRVTMQPARMPNVIAVRLVEAPRARPRDAAPEVPPDVAQAPVETPPVKPEAPRPPKELPKEKPKETPKERKEAPKPAAAKPAPEITAPVTAPATPASQPGADAGVTGPAVSGTDNDFPFAHYLKAIESRVVANWQPRQLGFGDRALVSCSVHFVINRAGVVSQVKLVRNSGIGVYDREAVRAVSATRLPPLPPQYRGTDLGVTFDFNLEPGSR